MAREYENVLLEGEAVIIDGDTTLLHSEVSDHLDGDRADQLARDVAAIADVQAPRSISVPWIVFNPPLRKQEFEGEQ